MKKRYSIFILSVLLVLVVGYSVADAKRNKKLREMKQEVSESYSEEKDWKREYKIYDTLK